MPETRVKPLTYRPPPPWYFWGAFGAALAIHLTAVALAQRREAPVEVPIIPPATVIEATLPPPEATPPPEDIPLLAPPPPPDIKPEYVEERTPPPRQPTAQKFAPIKSSEMSMSRAKALAVYAPRPQYPYEARSRHVMGSGVCVVNVDPGSGNVTSASMSQSIGNPILDNAATSSFRQWRFRPGTVSKVRIPITFTMTGASY
jgi:protein TonB